MLRVTNTLSWQKEDFKTITPNKVLFYQCGPTVYWNQHIGNMRGMTMADLIRKSLEYLGYNVKFVRNYTDFGHLTGDNIGDADTGEDRMEKAAKRENLTPKIIADKYIEQFEKDTSRLNIEEPTIKARATDYIEQMISMVQTLLDKGYAYVTPKAIYYDTTKFPGYYDLSGHVAEHNIEGAGHGAVSDPAKKNQADFALWFFRTGDHAKALQFWPSPFVSPEVENGYGFPGWHIECSAMSLSTLGETIDLHMGGVEHISIHHTNEIAQSEAATGKKFVNYWIHNEHLTQNGKKISKSDGNFYLLDDLIKLGFDPMDLRYLFLQAHYRSKQNFTIEALTAAKKSYESILNTYCLNLALAQVNFKTYESISESNNEATALKTGNIIPEYKEKFISAIEDDFNIPKALGILWELLNNKAKYLPEDIVATILDFDKVFGLKIVENAATISQPTQQLVTPEIQTLLDQRNEARNNKDWQTADEIRAKLKSQFNYEVVDKT